MNDLNKDLMDDLADLDDIQSNQWLQSQLSDEEYQNQKNYATNKNDIKSYKDIKNDQRGNLDLGITGQQIKRKQYNYNEENDLRFEEINDSFNDQKKSQVQKYNKKILDESNLTNRDDFKDSMISQSQMSYKKQNLPSKQIKKVNDSYLTNKDELKESMISQSQISQNKPPVQRKNHIPQIIDEDTEHFKIKLEHLLNVFKTDAISEFMTMKKSLLDDQNVEIREQTNKYLQMYEQKSHELEQTKDQLAQKIQECEILQTRTEVLASLYGKSKIVNKQHKLMSNCFIKLKLFQKYKKNQQKFAFLSNKQYERTLMKQSFCQLRSNKENMKLQKLQSSLEQTQEEQIQDLTNKFNKQIFDLSKQLQEVQQLYDNSESSKVSMQENLKKAFLRGVCAMNYEAINVIEGQEEISQLDPQQIDIKNQQMMQSVNNLGVQVLDENMLKNTHQNLKPKETQIRNLTNELNQQKKTVFFQNPAIESKDHRWQDAPVIGFNPAMTQAVKVDINQYEKQDYNHKQTEQNNNYEENYDYEPKTSIIQEKNIQQDVGVNVNEGKIIKVNHGKSYTYQFDEENQKTQTQVKFKEDKPLQKNVQSKSMRVPIVQEKTSTQKGIIAQQTKKSIIKK